jgi:anti-sigma regulatory factor (Ser/Thr protein kinase)
METVTTDWFERPRPSDRHRRTDTDDEQPEPPRRGPQQWLAAAPASGKADTVDGTMALPAAVPDEQGSGADPVMPGDLEVRTVLFGMDWPDRSYLELGAIASAVPCARLHAREVVREWELADLAWAVEQVVSELVTNSVRASKGLTASRFLGRWIPGAPPVRLWLNSDKRRVLIQVWDGDEHLPVRQPVDDLHAEHGRGLLLIEALSEQHGVYRLDGATGKVVWALCRS